MAGRPLTPLKRHSNTVPASLWRQSGRRTERILFCKGDELQDVVHPSVRLEGAIVHLIFAPHYNDKKLQGLIWTQAEERWVLQILVPFRTDWRGDRIKHRDRGENHNDLSNTFSVGWNNSCSGTFSICNYPLNSIKARKNKGGENSSLVSKAVLWIGHYSGTG